jgi:hypothetical protein
MKLLPVILPVLLCLALLPVTVSADEPLEAPGNKTIYSLNRKYSAFLDYERKITTVYSVSKRGRTEQRTKLWEMPGWFRNASLADDGEHLVVAYEGSNLLDLNYKQDEVMLTFYRRGELINRVRLNELLEDARPSKLERTVSHYKWTESYGFDEHGRYVVNTVEKRQFIFDVDTGQPVNTKLFTPAPAPSPAQPEATAAATATPDKQRAGKKGCLGTFLALACAMMMLGKR